MILTDTLLALALIGFQSVASLSVSNESDFTKAIQRDTIEPLPALAPMPAIYRRDGSGGALQGLNDHAALSLFADDGIPVYSDVAQSSMGDCWLVSVLASVAFHDPAKIQSMLVDHNDGSVTVSLYMTSDDLRNYTVIKPSLAQVSTYGSAYVGRSVWHVWPVVIEKAMMAYAAETTGIPGNLYGGYSVRAMDAIYGTHAFYGFWNKAANSDVVKSMLGMSRTVVTATDRCPATGCASFTKNGLPIPHAYSVMGFNTDTQMVRLRNPWGEITMNTLGIPGRGQGLIDLGDGVFEISYSDYTDTFGSITVGPAI